MIIGYVTSLGNFAFRHVPDSDPAGLADLLDAEGIDRALVSSLETIMYRNVQKGNELLAERIGPFNDRFIGAAVVNPIYAEPVEDLRVCIEKWHMRAVRLLPNYHGYSLNDPRVGHLLAACGELQVPVSIVFRVEDERQRHWLIDPGRVDAEQAAAQIAQFPQVNFVLERARFGEVKSVLKTAPDASNLFVETSGRFLLGPPSAGLREVIDAIGPERVLFGTDMPLQYGRAAILKIESLELSRQQKENVMGANAARLLTLESLGAA